MFDNRKRTKIKNSKIQSWRLELAEFTFEIQYREGRKNTVPDSLTRAYCQAVPSNDLEAIHTQLCHPGVTRFLHFVKTKNLPYSTDDVKKVCSSCRICANLKPNFYKPLNNKLIKSTHPMERISIDFKGPLPSSTRNKYFLTVIDEYSRFPFVIPCPDITTSTVIKCLESIFSLCGMSGFVHSDRGSSFMSAELKSYFANRGIATSHSTPYHPIGNGQVERYNGIVWKSVRLALATSKLPIQQWEQVLPDVLHSIRSLLSTATNTTPHERFFNFQRKSTQGISLPSWLTPGPVLLRKFVRSSKHDDFVDEVELTHANPTYAHIRYPDGRQSSVSLKDLAPCPRKNVTSGNPIEQAPVSGRNSGMDVVQVENGLQDNTVVDEIKGASPVSTSCEDIVAEPLRRSKRFKRKPVKLGFEDE